MLFGQRHRNSLAGRSHIGNDPGHQFAYTLQGRLRCFGQPGKRGKLGAQADSSSSSDDQVTR
jgi:hypothetical protein